MHATGAMRRRAHLEIRGRVQGVGFRPLVYRLATELGLSGCVYNDNRGVTLEIEGSEESIATFEQRLRRELKPPARIDELSVAYVESQGSSSFFISPSRDTGTKDTTLLADIAPCQDCQRDFEDPANRRHQYPFTNCTHCGPRFTIIRAVPYDRPNTTMAGFVQCPQCRSEYDDPANRRFHAQPNACPECGPQIALVDATGATVTSGGPALRAAADAIMRGRIVALQGVGGFQLLVDARNETAVQCLRTRKQRLEKPLALMVVDLCAAESLAHVNAEEAALLVSPEAPIVLLLRRAHTNLAQGVAPNNPYLGVLLPSSPLHHLLMQQLHVPVVCTSGNLSEEPICIDPLEAWQRLTGIADLWLVHDRPIERHADDSVAMVVAGEVHLQRRARGYAPLPVNLPARGPTVLALGGHQKCTIALAVGDRCFVSQHIGDLDTLETRSTYLRVISDFVRLYAATPAMLAHDLHPDYASSQLAERLTAKGGPFEGTPRLAVQHHHAHLASCLADAGTSEPVLGVVWDGSGLGIDRTLWGGEFLIGNAAAYQRVACLLPFMLPGGDRSARTPRRVAVALLYQLLGADYLTHRDIAPVACTSAQELRLMRGQIDKRILCPYTSSIGRLFDAVASLLDLRQEASFEGQAAMCLEFIADRNETRAYPLRLVERTMLSAPAADEALSQVGLNRPGLMPRFYLDPTDLLAAILRDLARGIERSSISARFHLSLVNAIVEIAGRVGIATVALSGGCFQNRLLLERCKAALELERHRVLLQHQVPANDGGLALGQAAVAISELS